MKWGVVTFPGSNDDRDTLHALSDVLGYEAVSLWHADTNLRGVDAVVLPGGFSYGDYLRCGAIARSAPIMGSLRQFAADGGPVLGSCNGFQILCEAGLLPGALVRNRDLRFVCRRAVIRVESNRSAFSLLATPGSLLEIPIKHGEGCYVASEAVLADLEARSGVIFRYAGGAPNGAMADIAGICNETGNVVGMMPHPEHAVDALLGSEDGQVLFRSAAAWLERAARKAG